MELKGPARSWDLPLNSLWLSVRENIPVDLFGRTFAVVKVEGHSKIVIARIKHLTNIRAPESLATY
jgi:hypothetical protein